MNQLVPSRRRLIKESEAAEILNIEVQTLRRWRCVGKPPGYVKVGGAVRYELADIEAFIEAGRRNNATLSNLTSETPDEC